MHGASADPSLSLLVGYSQPIPQSGNGRTRSVYGARWSQHRCFPPLKPGFTRDQPELLSKTDFEGMHEQRRYRMSLSNELSQ